MNACFFESQVQEQPKLCANSSKCVCGYRQQPRCNSALHRITCTLLQCCITNMLHMPQLEVESLSYVKYCNNLKLQRGLMHV